ncbi:IS3 family transposase [Paenibacillus ottowii]
MNSCSAHSAKRLLSRKTCTRTCYPMVGAQISMSRRGNCYDNASLESFFSHLKTEGLYPYHIRTVTEAQSKIEKYIRFYNRKRPQRKLKKLTPIEYRRQFAA